MKTLIATLLTLSMYTAAAAEPGLFQMVASSGNGKFVWVMNTETGAIRICVAKDKDTAPECSPFFTDAD